MRSMVIRETDRKLHPIVAIENDRDPGWKLNNGFFSIGSIFFAMIVP